MNKIDKEEVCISV